LKPHVDMSRTALFDVLFQYEENPLQITAAANLKIEPVETNLGWGKYDLNMLIKDGGDSFQGVLVYNAQYYKDSTMIRLLAHYKTLLENILQEPRKPIARFSLLSAKEKHRLVNQWNRTEANYPGNKTLHHVFQEHVEKYPQRVSVIHEDKAITYRELNNRANHLANYLKGEYNTRPDAMVGIMLEPSIDMMGVDPRRFGPYAARGYLHT
ncbi:MAG: AMP-binding protein, partial [bacterium]|nr:AMP-binding protein [bacterium]